MVKLTYQRSVRPVLLIHQILSGCQCILYANLDSETTAFPSDKTRSIIDEHVF
jgi:hypothetical protein